ncbi:MAG: UDP-galactopyranose mutase [Bacilli bacterium]|nr:UDP-galactopyranose mutase [Bacilli bacterium]
MKYDYLIVGAGLFGATFANEMTKNGKKCLVIEKRDHIGGNIYCENINGINVHKYGAHIFHTSDKYIWDYINQFAEFNNYINSPIANYNGKIYNMPFNMNTFSKIWDDVITPEDAKKKIEEEKKELLGKTPENLEEQAISLVGRTIYEKLIKGYTEKQWGKDCKELPAFIIKRLPLRYTYNNNYFNDRYQGIPIGGYNQIIEKMLKGSSVILNVDYLKEKDKYQNMAKKIIYTGTIDKYYDYILGNLEYRSLKFETIYLKNNDNYQGNAVVNYTDRLTPYTRIIEHKHFEFNECLGTVITKEYPSDWNLGDEEYYPVNDDKNNKLYEKYLELAKKEEKVIFGGRLGHYKYYDMDKVIMASLDLVKKELESEY